MTDNPLKRIIRGILQRARAATDAAPADSTPMVGATKFEQRAPAHANAIDIFSGHWATDLSEFSPAWHGGSVKLGTDPRPRSAAEHLGKANRLDGMTVLELGPLEGAHSYQLEKLGAARILAIESNVEAYLKCLIVKEALGLKRCEFLLGDFALYLQNCSERFDMVFASGVLYHMEDPIAVVRDIARVTDRCFVWTHYLEEKRDQHRVAVPVTRDGMQATYFRAPYLDRARPVFWGGNKPSASWMKREDILAAFRHFGLDQIAVIADEPEAAHGANFCFAASRRGR
ncbi:MAG: methyltransferase domain-containing protein [Alphaproteobacteria bacterium]|nr:MAG: methyltransferase domain-containing protein [Alphaproteobacteria bacterium]